MKHLIPFAASIAFALWTYVLLSYQKRLIHQKLNKADVKIKVEEKVEDLIGRIVPDLALPFLPSSLISRLKSRGSDELIKLIPQINEEVDSQFKKYTLWIVLASAIFGLIFGFFCVLAACPESYS